MRTAIPAALILTALGLHAQQQPNTVSVTVSTTQAMTAGTATVRVQFLDASLASTVDTALAVLGSVGVAAANLADISVSISQGFIITQYDFVLNVPASQFTATRDRLLAAQRSIANISTQAVAWSTSYAASDEDAAKALETAMPKLLELAKVQANVLASAMGGKPGKIVSLAAPAVTNAGLSLAVSATVTYAVE